MSTVAEAYERIQQRSIVQPNGCVYISKRWNPKEITRQRPNVQVGNMLVRASRVVLAYHGALPLLDTSVYALHTCDDGRCVNREHLYAGSPADNTRDTRERGRDNDKPLRGDEASWSKLTSDDVLKIRRLYATGNYTQTKLATIYGVRQSQIGNVVNFKSWTHL